VKLTILNKTGSIFVSFSHFLHPLRFHDDYNPGHQLVSGC